MRVSILPSVLFRQTGRVLPRERTRDERRLRGSLEEGEAGRASEITETFRRQSEGSRDRGRDRREGGRPQRRAGSEQVTGSSAPSSAVPRHGRSRSTPVLLDPALYLWIRITRDRFFDDLCTRCFSPFFAAPSTRSFPQHQFFRRYSCADVADDCTFLVHATCRRVPTSGTVERVLSRKKDYDRESSLGVLLAG